MFKTSNACSALYGPRDTAYQPSSKEKILIFSLKILENCFVDSSALIMLGSVSTCTQRLSFADAKVLIKRYIIKIFLIIVFPTIGHLGLSSDHATKYLQ